MLLLLNNHASMQVVYRYEDGLRWALQIASALAHLHAQRPLIIHRDLKLDNVLLTGMRVCKENVKCSLLLPHALSAPASLLIHGCGSLLKSDCTLCVEHLSWHAVCLHRSTSCG